MFDVSNVGLGARLAIGGGGRAPFTVFGWLRWLLRL